MRRTLACSAAAVVVSAALLAGCSPNENVGGSNVGPAIDDPQVTEEGATEDPGAEPSADGATAGDSAQDDAQEDADEEAGATATPSDD